MSAIAGASPSLVRSGFRAELSKVPAFLRRDLLIQWSYRGQFVSDWANLAVQAFLFYLVGRLVDPSKLPQFGGQRATYLEFVSVGIAINAFVQLGLGRVAAAIRKEQMVGTLEALLMTPTAPATIQVGSVVYDLIYVPARTAAFLMVVGLGFGLQFHAGGLAPGAVILLLFIPFVWGLGVISAAVTLTFKRGGSGVGFLVMILTIGSGAYFPLGLLPHWLSRIASFNPIAIAIDGIRQAIIGAQGWNALGFDQLVLLPISILSLAAGIVAFKLAVLREQRRGTLSTY